MKRNNYLSWDQYFMSIASLSGLRSKDPVTQVGACLINQEKRIIGIGYNGFPQGISDDEFPWDNKNQDHNKTKYPYVVHAEANAILNATSPLRGSTIYVTLFPCSECMKLIIQSGIKEIVYSSNKYKDSLDHEASLKMLKAVNVKCRKVKQEKVTIDEKQG